MPPFLLYHAKSSVTGRQLATELRIHGGTLCKRSRYERISHLIRWGSARDIPGHAAHTINSQEAILLAGSKLRSLEVLRKAGVPVPPTTHRLGDGMCDNGTIWFGRTFHHTRGEDIVVLDINTPDRVWELAAQQCDYFTKYIPTHKEYRVHVIGGKAIHVQKKYFRQTLYTEMLAEVPQRQREEFKRHAELIRNNGHGWGFYDVKDMGTVPEVIITTAVKAVELLGLDFGAVDISSTERDERGRRGALVFEVNTAPALRERNVKLYATKFKELMA